MAEVIKRLLRPDRRRTPPAIGFSWIDRRLVRERFLAGLTGPEALLYFFLVTVADRDGLSFHGDQKTADLLKLTPTGLGEARRGLEHKDLICFRAPLYQVLALPDMPSNLRLADSTLEADRRSGSRERGENPAALGEVIRALFKPAD